MSQELDGAAQHARVTLCPFASSQNLPRLPNRLSCCNRLDGRAILAEARQEQSCRAVLSVVTRITALLLPALTDHPAGLVRVELEGKRAGDAISFNGTELVLRKEADDV